MIFVKKFRFLMIFILCLMLSLPAQASNQLTLYSNWRAQITFDANGGVLTGGATDAERALAGQSSGTLSMSSSQQVSTGLLGSKSGYLFLEWNTRADGMGTAISDYGMVQGPVTFYAIYYKTDYDPMDSLQTFWAPWTGWYELSCWGASGTDCSRQDVTGWGGRGGYTAGQMYLTKGTTLYVWVGTNGGDSNDYDNPSGLPGHSEGRASMVTGRGGASADIRTGTDLNSRVMAAAGGGSGAVYFYYGRESRNGGNAGGLQGGNGGGMTFKGGPAAPTGATQNRGGDGYGSGPGWIGQDGSFGTGGWPTGGDGWYGGGHSGQEDCVYSGGGGSSYVSGFPGCAISPTGVVLTNPRLSSGSDVFTSPFGGLETGHSGKAHARLVCIQRA